MSHNVSIRPVSKENLASGLQLGSSMEHRYGTQPVLETLARCWLNRNPHPYYIYLDDQPVGFALMTDGRDRVDGHPVTKLKSFLIDARYQGRGLAKPSLRLLLVTSDKDVVLAVHPENTRAIAIYRDLGFADCYQRGGWNYMICRRQSKSG